MSTSEEREPLVQLEGVGKHYGNIIALRDIDLEVDWSEITCVLGDNGAGKSTLIKIITGVHAPDEGDILFDGQVVHDLDVRRARELGVETVFQERALA